MLTSRATENLFRGTDFPRSRKTDGKHGNGLWKRKMQFQAENHGKPLLSGGKKNT